MSVFVLLLLGLTLCTSQNITTTGTAPNTTTTTRAPVKYTPQCERTNPTCNGRGVCEYEGVCRCYIGFFGVTSTRGLSSTFHATADNCILAIHDIPAVKQQVIQFRIFIGVTFTFLAVLMIYRLIIEFIMDTTTSSTSVITKYTMLTLILFCGCLSIMSGDFFGGFSNYDVKFSYFLYYFKDNLLLLVFSALLFHWAELYHSSISKLKREEMLRKIKPDYESNVSMEDVLIRMNIMSRFRFGYIAVCVLSFLVLIGMMVVEFHARDNEVWKSYCIFYYAFYVVAWISFALAYIFYGLRLISIIPQVLKGKIKTVMILMGLFALCTVTFACLMIAVQVLPGRTTINITTIYAMLSLCWGAAFCALNIFMPVWKWHIWFSPSLARSVFRSKSNSSNPNTINTEEMTGRS